MIPYIPKIGDTVEVVLYMKVTELRQRYDGSGDILVTGLVKIREDNEVVVGSIPLQACSEFFPVRDGERNLATGEDGE
jgi:hypothetical protein